MPDYDDYVRKHNSAVLSGKEKGLALVASNATVRALGIRWDAVLRLCEGEDDYDALRAEELGKRLVRDHGPLELVSSEGVGQILGRTSSDIWSLSTRGMLPVPVLILTKVRGWLIKDIEAFAAGRQVPARQENELRPLVMTTAEVADLLSTTPDNLTAKVRRQSPTVPLPDGRLIQQHYWMRAKTEQWVSEHGNSRPRS